MINTNNGYCHCGCGQQTSIANRSLKGRAVKGQHYKYVHSHSHRRPLVERFWEKVNKQGPMPHAEAVRVYPEIAGTCCWVWTGFLNEDGYGQIRSSELETQTSTQRAAWFIETGNVPNQEVCHKCDNPACVRFRHLFEGTHTTNMQDMAIKGRHRSGDHRGEANEQSRFSTEDVMAIRQALAQGTLQLTLAMKYNTSQGQISAIKRGKIWKHLPILVYEEANRRGRKAA